ncbi:hypothetical protein R6Q59_033716 [Mikania micrantha]
MQRACCIILYLCGGTLISDSLNNLVSLSILNNLENLTVCGQLSWGSVVLVVLYRNLCKSTSSNANNCSCGHGVESLLLHQGFYIHLIIEDHMVPCTITTTLFTGSGDGCDKSNLSTSRGLYANRLNIEFP